MSNGHKTLLDALPLIERHANDEISQTLEKFQAFDFDSTNLIELSQKEWSNLEEWNSLLSQSQASTERLKELHGEVIGMLQRHMKTEIEKNLGIHHTKFLSIEVEGEGNISALPYVQELRKLNPNNIILNSIEYKLKQMNSWPDDSEKIQKLKRHILGKIAQIILELSEKGEITANGSLQINVRLINSFNGFERLFTEWSNEKNSLIQETTIQQKEAFEDTKAQDTLNRINSTKINGTIESSEELAEDWENIKISAMYEELSQDIIKELGGALSYNLVEQLEKEISTESDFQDILEEVMNTHTLCEKLLQKIAQYDGLRIKLESFIENQKTQLDNNIEKLWPEVDKYFNSLAEKLNQTTDFPKTLKVFGAPITFHGRQEGLEDILEMKKDIRYAIHGWLSYYFSEVMEVAGEVPKAPWKLADHYGPALIEEGMHDFFEGDEKLIGALEMLGGAGAYALMAIIYFSVIETGYRRGIIDPLGKMNWISRYHIEPPGRFIRNNSMRDPEYMKKLDERDQKIQILDVLRGKIENVTDVKEKIKYTKKLKNLEKGLSVHTGTFFLKAVILDKLIEGGSFLGKWGTDLWNLLMRSGNSTIAIGIPKTDWKFKGLSSAVTNAENHFNLDKDYPKKRLDGAQYIYVDAEINPETGVITITDKNLTPEFQKVLLLVENDPTLSKSEKSRRISSLRKFATNLADYPNLSVRTIQLELAKRAEYGILDTENVTKALRKKYFPGGEKELRGFRKLIKSIGVAIPFVNSRKLKAFAIIDLMEKGLWEGNQEDLNNLQKYIENKNKKIFTLRNAKTFLTRAYNEGTHTVIKDTIEKFKKRRRNLSKPHLVTDLDTGDMRQRGDNLMEKQLKEAKAKGAGTPLLTVNSSMEAFIDRIFKYSGDLMSEDGNSSPFLVNLQKINQEIAQYMAANSNGTDLSNARYEELRGVIDRIYNNPVHIKEIMLEYLDPEIERVATFLHAQGIGEEEIGDTIKNIKDQIEKGNITNAKDIHTALQEGDSLKPFLNKPELANTFNKYQPERILGLLKENKSAILSDTDIRNIASIYSSKELNDLWLKALDSNIKLDDLETKLTDKLSSKGISEPKELSRRLLKAFESGRLI